MDNDPRQNDAPPSRMEEDESPRGLLSGRQRTCGSPPITILLVEDHTVVRHGLRALLKAHEQFSIVGEAEHGRQGIQLAKELSPDVILMDIAMPCLNGIEATRQILKSLPEARVLILSTYTEDCYVQQAMEAGAVGYLDKGISDQELMAALRMAKSRIGLFSPAIAQKLQYNRQKGFFSGEPGRKRRGTLTSRELEVLQLIAEGKANKETATELSISIKTVEQHRQSIMDKLSIHQTAGLTRYAIDMGIIATTGNMAFPSGK